MSTWNRWLPLLLMLPTSGCSDPAEVLWSEDPPDVSGLTRMEFLDRFGPPEMYGTTRDGRWEMHRVADAEARGDDWRTAASWGYGVTQIDHPEVPGGLRILKYRVAFDANPAIPPEHDGNDAHVFVPAPLQGESDVVSGEGWQNCDEKFEVPDPWWRWD